MGFAAFFGPFLLGAGPIIVLYIALISPKSFLVLLSLGSAFYWLVTLFVISALFRAWAPLDPSIGPYIGLVFVAVLIQELARLGIWRFHLKSLSILQRLAREHPAASLKLTDHFSLSITHGIAHAAVHSLFFFVSWLPLSFGDGTLYIATCPKISFYVLSAVSTLCFAALLISGMVVCLEALESQNLIRAALPTVAHLAASLFTLLNFVNNGCYISLPLLFVVSVGVSVLAYKVWWEKTGAALRYTPTVVTDSTTIHPSERNVDD